MGVAAGDDLPRTDTLNPGDPVRMLSVGRTPDLAFVRPGGRQNALEFEAGDDVLYPAVAVVPPHRGVENLIARRKNDRADPYFQLRRPLFKVNGVVLADSLANPAFFLLKIKAGFGVYVTDERHCLGKMNMDRFGQRQVLIVRIRLLDRAVLETRGATRTYVLVDVSGLPVQGYGEVSRFPFDTDHFGIGQYLYIGMSAAFNELGRFNAHGAVIGRKCLVELGHLAADRGRFIDQVNPEAGSRKIEGGLNTADPRADNQRIAK